MRALLVTLLLSTSAVPSYGQWTEAPGTGWFQANLYHHDTRRVFDAEGNAERIFADGHAVTTSLYLSAAVGVVRGVDVWAQLPLHRLVFDDAAGRRLRTGLGDPRVYLRAGPSLFGWHGPVPIALRAGVKLPGGDFPVDAEVVPLGEGQRDWELLLEAGHAFGKRPLYVMGWLGYRWREANRTAARAPGDERFAFAATGGRLMGNFAWKLAMEGWLGRTPRFQGVAVPSARRAMLHVTPHLGWRLGPGVLETGTRLPLAGRNVPAGPAFSIGYFFTWNGPF